MVFQNNLLAHIVPGFRSVPFQN